jgi:fluoroquinolone transport system permease protein
MNMVQAIRALGPVDMRNVRRDPMLKWMVYVPLFLGFVLRFGMPFLFNQILAWFNFDLTLYIPLMMSMMVMLIPMIYGSVVGFLLLDQRDDHTIEALQVTPLSLRGYFSYRISIPILLGLVGNMVMLPLSGLCDLSLGGMLLVSLASAGLTPIYALFYAGFAQNKVQGFALMKLSGMFFMPVLAAYFVSGPARWFFGILPPFWPMQLYWTLAFLNFWQILLLLAAGFILQGVYLVAMLRYFTKRLEK